MYLIHRVTAAFGTELNRLAGLAPPLVLPIAWQTGNEHEVETLHKARDAIGFSDIFSIFESFVI
jgi:hypothetical protein